MTAPRCYRLSPGGLSLYLRVTPSGGSDAVEGVEIRADGTAVLRVRVRAVPDKGKANAAVVALLAKALGVSKSSVSVVSGSTARLKTLAVAGEPAELERTLNAIAQHRSAAVQPLAGSLAP